MKLVIIFCAILAQTFGAPKPCLDRCGPSSTYTHETIAGINTHGSLMAQQNAAFQQLHQNLLSQLQQAQANLDYSRPGTWSEHNAYRANDGGQVHEEHGQVEGGNAKLRYFKKNYTNSWGSGAGAFDSGALSSNLLNTHGNLQHGVGGGSAHREEYHSDYHSSSNTGGHAANVEDFGVQQVPTSDQVTQSNINVFNDWVNRLESYITQCSDRVQSGQLSNYQTYADVVQQNLDQMRQQIRDAGLWNNFLQQINSLERSLNEFKHQAQSSNLVNTSSWNKGSVVTGSSSHHEVVGSVGSVAPIAPVAPVAPIAPVAPVAPIAPVGREEHYSEYKKEHSVKTSGRKYAPVQTVPANTYVQGSAGGYQHTSTGQGYTAQNQLVASGAQHADYQQQQQQQQYAGYNQHSQYNQHSDQYNQHSGQYNQHSGQYDQHSGQYDQHSGQYDQHSGQYNQHNAHYDQVHTPGKRVEEEWNASGRRTETTYPHQVITSHASGNEAAEKLTHYGGHSGYSQGYNQGYTHGSSSSYSSGGSFSSFGAQSGGLQTETVDLGYGSGCQSQQYGSPCRRYKRDLRDDLSQQTEDLTQQTEDLTQQTEDLTQQTQQLTQQHVGNLQLGSHQGGQSGQYRQNDSDFTDYSQQRQSGGIEFGSQRDRHEDRGYGSYGQDNRRGGVHGHEQHGHDDGDEGRYSQQSSGYGDYNQQQSGSYESGSQRRQQQSRHENHGYGDASQQRDRNEGSGRGVHGHEDHGYGDASQQQETYGNRRHDAHGREDHGYGETYQQSQGIGEYSQQPSRNLEVRQERDQQQTGGIEFGQNRRTQGPGEYYGGYPVQTDDLTQQTQRGFGDFSQQPQPAGSIELGGYSQRRQPNRYGGYTQQTEGFEDLTQQGSNLDYTQQNQNRQQSNRYGGYTQQTEDLTQQTEDLTQQTEDLTQQTEDLTQQTGAFGQQRQRPSYGDYSQQRQPGDVELGSSHPAPKPPARGQRIGHSERGDTTPDYDPALEEKGRHRRPYQTGYPQQTDSESQGVVPLEEQIQQTSAQQWHNAHQPGDLTRENLQARSLDGTQNSGWPEPTYGAEWDATTTTTPAPGFWHRVGHKITSTYEKAKDKISNTFG